MDQYGGAHGMPSMTPGKKRRVATAAGFLSGVLACLDALRDKSALWPPDVVWQSLRNPQKLEFGAGVVLMLVTIAIAALRGHSASER
jgi:hypothetical protein